MLSNSHQFWDLAVWSMSAKVLKDKFHLLYFCHFLPDLNLIIISRPKFIFITIHFQNTPNYLRRKNFLCSFYFFLKLKRKPCSGVYTYIAGCFFVSLYLYLLLPKSRLNNKSLELYKYKSWMGLSLYNFEVKIQSFLFF